MMKIVFNPNNIKKELTKQEEFNLKKKLYDALNEEFRDIEENKKGKYSVHLKNQIKNHFKNIN